MWLEKRIIALPPLSFGIFLLGSDGCISNKDYVDINKAYREFSEGLRKYRGERKERMEKKFDIDFEQVRKISELKRTGN